MKTLVIYTNKLQCENIIDDNNNFDIFLDNSCQDINDLYRKCPKTYCYYLFAGHDINLSKDDINEIINIIKMKKPAIIYLSYKTKVYHRSVIHYSYPLLSYKKYGEYIYDILEIVEKPLKNYTVYLNSPRKINESLRNKDLKWRALIHWFGPSIKKYNKNTSDKYIMMDEEIDQINFMNTFDIFKYFDINHAYFKDKRIKFHKNNREIYGNCAMYHFKHDFHNVNRNSIINHLIKKYNYKKYLEIGVYNCYHFNEVYVDEKYGVDPSPKLDDPVFKRWQDNIYQMTSINFFEENDEKYDIIFIDGCLYEYNVMTDVINGLKCLNENGTIVLHDCNPPIEFLQRDDYNTRYKGSKENKIIWNNRTYTDRHYVGKVWKVITKLRSTRKDLEVYVVDSDWGVGIIRKGEQKLFDLVDKRELNKYETFVKYRRHMLNLISAEKFLEIFD